MKHSFKSKIICLLFTVAMAAGAQAQTMYYVNAGGGSDSNNGETWATAFATLQAVPAGTRGLPLTIVGRGQYVLIPYISR